MNSVKRNASLAAVVGLMALSATQACASVITVDEYGNGTIDSTPLPSQIFQEPISGIPTVQYTLPFPGVAGDVLILEPASGDSDLARYDGAGHLYMFSDNTTVDAPADVGIPTHSSGNFVNEVGAEGNNYAIWIPTSGQPGYEATANPQYVILSDVPETGVLPALAVTLLAAGGVEFRRRLSRKAA
jgi:hypothetical protein